MDPKVVLVTGGQGDLAQAIAAEASQAGYQPLLPSHSELDVSCKEAVTDYFNSLDQTVDLLINNAGVTRDNIHSRINESDWDLVVNANLKGSFLCSQAALKQFPRKLGGHIINIGSFSGNQPPVGQANYAAAKAGLVGLSKSLAKEYGRRKIRINTVLPGFLETKMTANLSANARQRIRDRHVLGSFNTVCDAARFIIFLDSLTEVSGQVFQLDSRV